MTAAILFQNMPPLSPEEYQALETSIREHGVQVPIVVDENRTVIDGHHRQKIAQELGIECPRRFALDLDEPQKRTLALSLNLDRRHLNREQRRALIAESIKADPELTDREHARRTGASPSTVGTVRTDLEASGDVSKLDTRTDSLGREQPASKPWTEPTPPFDPATGELLDDEPEPAPAPKPDPPKTRRRPITDQARDAGWDLRKVVERLQRIAADDRVAANKEQVTAHLRGHLLFTVEACQGLIDQITQEGA